MSCPCLGVCDCPQRPTDVDIIDRIGAIDCAGDRCDGALEAGE